MKQRLVVSATAKLRETAIASLLRTTFAYEFF